MSYPSKNQRFRSERVISGHNDKKGDHPYQISLQKLPVNGNWYHTCGGSIISSTRILTAAHCIDSGVASDFRIVAGEYDLSTREGTEQTIPVSEL